MYAGTNSKDIKDINQDVQTFGMGSQSGQVQDANTMADYAMRIAKEHGYGHVEFSGHSLGGGLALYEAARKEQAARTFSAADPWNALSDESRKWAKSHKDKLIDYRHDQDIVTGSTNLLTVGTANKTAKVVWSKYAKTSLDGHGLDLFHFDGGRVSVDSNGPLSDAEVKNRWKARLAALVAPYAKKGAELYSGISAIGGGPALSTLTGIAASVLTVAVGAYAAFNVGKIAIDSSAGRSGDGPPMRRQTG